MPTPPEPLPGGCGSGPFRVDDERLTGVPATRLRRSDLSAPIHGVRLAVALEDDHLDVVRALALVMRDDQRFSHLTAAGLWDFPLPRRLGRTHDPVHVTTVGAGPVMRRRGVVGHRSLAVLGGSVRIRDLPVSNAVGTWCECAGVLRESELVIIGDHIVGERRLATPDQLVTAARARRSRGAVSLRRAAERVRVGSESPMETITRLVVEDRGLPAPELNVAVFDDAGTFLGRPDMIYRSARVAIEYDGDHHRTDRRTWQHDASRSNGFGVNGWTVLHVTARDVGAPDDFLERLSQALRRSTRPVA